MRKLSEDQQWGVWIFTLLSELGLIVVLGNIFRFEVGVFVGALFAALNGIMVYRNTIS
jgi:hypothetical protein